MVESDATTGVISRLAEGDLNPRDFRSDSTFVKNYKRTAKKEGSTWW